MVGSAGMTDTLISYAAVQGSALSDTNIVGRVLGETRFRESRLYDEGFAHVLRNAGKKKLRAGG